MHTSDVMAAAVHAARASPPRFQTLHPPLAPPPPSLAMTPPISLPPVDKRQYMSSLHFPGSHHHSLPFHPLPLLPPPPPTSTTLLPPQTALQDMDDDFGEDVDEDDMSDLEEELQNELLALQSRQNQPDMTRQLLSFADMVNTDIQKFFGRKKGDDDSCDVYEDKWTVTKSGRELYYADLLKMAQGDFGDSKSSKAPKTSSRNKDVEALEDNRHSFSGKADSSKGLGPLTVLFEQGLMKPTGGKQNNSSFQQNKASSKRARVDTDSSSVSGAESLPMHQRRFPDSFWREPGLQVEVSMSGTNNFAGIASDATAPVLTSSVLQSLGSSKLPDFSDLMESWHGGEQSQLQQHQLHPLHQIQHHQYRNSVIAPETFNSTVTSTDSPGRKRRL